MTRFQFTVVIPANGGAAVNLAAAAFAGVAGIAYPNGHIQAFGTGYLPCTRLEGYSTPGNDTGSAYLGPAGTTYAGVNKAYDLPPGSGANLGGYILLQSYTDSNTEDLANIWLHGSNPGDIVTFVYHQA
jgi:hypothetical protein